MQWDALHAFLRHSTGLSFVRYSTGLTAYKVTKTVHVGIVLSPRVVLRVLVWVGLLPLHWKMAHRLSLPLVLLNTAMYYVGMQRPAT